MSDRDVAVLLACFAGKKDASAACKPLEAKLRSNGDAVLQTTILAVNGKHKASVHDPRRVIAGTLTAALTWGLFGLVAGTNKLESTIIWAVIGAICGGLWAYGTEHVLTKAQLARIGRRMAPNSSALITYAETADPASLLAATAQYTPSAASVATIDADLSARVFAGATAPIELPHGSSRPIDETATLSMLLFRYPDPKKAAEVAKAVSNGKTGANGAPQVELVIETARNGRRRVIDPTRGTAAWARSDVISWGLFGVAFGAIAGAVGGGGFGGAVDDAVATGIGWAIFGLVAGALYGLWVGRSISARRLKGVGSLLAPGTSAVLAWADGAVRPGAIDGLSAPGSTQLVLAFNAVEGGALLEAS